MADRLWRVVVAGLLAAGIGFSTLGHRQQDASEAERRAARYADALRKRPSSSYLFDRFYDTWLTWGSAESLAEHLRGRVESAGEPVDHLILALFHARGGDTVEAIKVLDEAATDDAPAIIWFHKADLEAQTLDFDTALVDLERAANASPDDTLAERVGRLRGRLHARRGEVEEAVAAWEALLAQQPDDLDLREDLVELLVEEGFHDEALDAANALLERLDDAYRWVQLKLRVGDIQVGAGRRGDAVSTWDAALARTGSGSWLERETLASIEKAFRDGADTDGLREHLAGLADDNGDRIAIHQRLANVLSELGEHDDAIESWREILERTPGDRGVREAYVAALVGMEAIDEAADVVESLSRQHPDDPELLLRLAELRYRTSAPDDAAAAIERYLEVAETSAFNTHRASQVLESFGMMDRAEAVHRGFVEATEGDERLAARETLATFLHRVGKRGDARDEWRSLADGADVRTLLRISDAAAIRGERELSLQLLEQRTDEFGDDQVFVATLARRLLEGNRATDAVPWALTRLRRAADAREVDAALEAAALVIRRADAVDEHLHALGTATTANELALRADLFESRGEGDRAEAALEQVAAKDAALAARRRIAVYESRHDWERAVAAIEDLVGLPGGRKPAMLRRLVEAHRRVGNLEDALTWTHTWRSIAPGATATWLVEAEILGELGRDEDAFDVLRDASRRFETDEGLQVRLAQLYVEQLRFAEAERVYWRLHADATDRAARVRWVNELAKLASSTGEVDRLVETFRERRRADRSNLDPVLALAEIYRVTHDDAARRDALADATRLAPNDLGLLQTLARLEEEDGRLTLALATLERAAAIDPTPESRRRMARIHFDMGNDQAGYALVWELVGGATADIDGLETVALLMAERSDWSMLADLFDRHADIVREDYRLAYLGAIALAETDQFEAARDGFLRILDLDAERPGRHPLQTQSMWATWYAAYGLRVPPETTELLEIYYAQTVAFAYKQRNFNPMIVGTTSAITLPDNLKAAHHYAIAHVAMMSAHDDEDTLDELARTLAAKGVPAPELFLDGTFGDPFSRRLTPDPDATYADDPTVLAFLLISGMAQQGDDTLLVHAFDTFVDTWPDLAMFAAASLLQMNAEAGVERMTRVLESTESVEDPSPFMVMTFSQLLSLRGAMSWELPEELADAISERVVRWYPKVRATPQMQWAFQAVIGSIARLEDGARLAQFLDDELAKQSRSSTPMGVSFGPMMPQPGGLTPMTFPPAALSSVPAHVVAAITPQDTGGVIVYGQPSFDEATLIDAAEAARNPTLRVLLAHAAENASLVDELIGEMMDGEQPSIDTCLLGATWRMEHHRDPVGAIEILERARQLPMQRQMRRQIDTAILIWATEASEDAASTRDSGKRAGLRLSRTVSAQEQHAIVSALEDLGFDAEAEQVERRAGPAPAMPAGVPSPMISGNAVDEVRKAANRGDLDKAAEGAAKFLEQMVQNNNAMASWEIERVVQIVEAHDLADRILEELDRGATSSIERRLTFGGVCEALGRFERAREIYVAIVEGGARTDQALMRLAVLVGRDDPVQGAAILQRIPENRALNRLGVQDYLVQRSTSMQYIDGSNGDSSAMLNVYDMLARWLATLERPEQGNLTSVMTVVQMLESGWAHGSSHLHPIFDTTAPSEAELADVYARRAAVHRAVCSQMLRNPETARFAFGRLAAWDEHEGVEAGSMVDAAERILVELKSAPAMAMGTVIYGTSSSQSPRFPSPEEYLAQDAWRTGDRGRIDDVLIPALRAAGRGTLADDMDRLCATYFAEPDDFLAAAQALIDDAPRRTSLSIADRARLVVEARTERDLDVDLLEVIAAALGRSVKTGMWPDLSWVTEYLASLDDGPAIARAFERMTTELLGSPEERAKLIEKHRERLKFGGMSTGNQGLSVHYMLVEQSLSHEKLLFHALSCMRMYPDAHNQRSFRIRAAMNNFHDPEKAIAFFDQSPLTADADTFELGIYGDAQTDNILDFFASRNSSSTVRRAVVERYRSIEDPTFGQAIIAIRLGSEPDSTVRLLETIGAHIDVIETRDDAFQDDLSRWLVRLDEVADRVEADARVGYDWVMTRRGAQPSPLDTFLAVEHVRDLDTQPSELADHVASLIRQRDKDDPEKVLAVIAKAIEFYEASYANDPRVIGDFKRELVRSWIGGEHHVDALILLDEMLVLDTEQIIRITPHGLGSSAFGQMPIDGYAEAERLDRAKMAFQYLCDSTADHPLTVSMRRLNEDLLDVLRTDDAESLIEWAQASPYSTSDPVRTEELIVMARFRWLLGKSRDQTAEFYERADAWVDERLRDASIGVDRRMWLIGRLATRLATDRASIWLPAAAATFAEAIDDDQTQSLGFGFDEVMQSIREAPRDDAWQQSVAALLDAAEARVDRDGRQSRQGLFQVTGTSWSDGIRQPSGSLLLSALAVEADRPDVAKKLIAESRSSLHRDPGAWVLLIHMGETTSVARSARSVRAAFSDLDMPTGIDYTAEVAANWPECRDDINDASLALAVEALLSACPDAASLGDAAPPRRDRLVALARRIASHDFDDEGIERVALAQLCDEPDASALVEQRIADAIEDIDPSALLMADDANLRSPIARLIGANLRMALMRGHPEPWFDATAGVEGVTNRHHQAGQYLALLQQAMIDATPTVFSQWTEIDFDLWLPVVRTVTYPSSELAPWSSVLGRTVLPCLIWHALGDDEEGWAAFGELMGNRVYQRYRLSDLFEVAEPAVGPESSLPIETRIDAMLRIVQFTPQRRGNDPIPTMLVELGLLTEDEVVDHAERLAAGIGHMMSVLDLAVRLDAAGRVAQGAALWTRVEEGLPADASKRIDFAVYATKRGRLDDAARVLGTVDATTDAELAELGEARDLLDKARTAAAQESTDG